MIELEGVKKIYPGTDVPAVDNLDLTVKEGEICVMVGTSGCGKTTTMKMINRIIEPTSGIIKIAGENVMDRDPNELRLEIGYVIQKIGLFPHYTIFENIATVPRLLGWNEKRIKARVSELMEMVGLEEHIHAHKYPKQLSGGQNQRVGLARAMAVDPPVMLMDEPFGAVDPITRAGLQNEFLKLQKKIRKTICFVTHDIDEAIKMGDRIALMHNGRIEQYDTPQNLLLHPKDQFVEDFVGRDRAMKVLHLLKMKEIMLPDVTALYINEPIRETFPLPDCWVKRIPVVDYETKRLQGYVDREVAEDASVRWQDEIKQYPFTMTPESSYKEAVIVMLQYGMMSLPVVDDENRYLGMVDFDMIRDHVGDACELVY